MVNYTSHNWELQGDFKMLKFYLVSKEDIQSIHAFAVCEIEEVTSELFKKAMAIQRKTVLTLTTLRNVLLVLILTTPRDVSCCIRLI